MITVPATSGKTIAVMGLGVAGLSAARALMESGARVMAWDDNPAGRDAAAAKNIPIVDLAGADWRDIALLVLSPGIPHRFPMPHPIAAMAEVAGVPVICDVDLLGRANLSTVNIGITGTNGKSTTTALIGHLLKAANTAVQIGGNLGPAVMDFTPPECDETHFILELSSYQLERIPSLHIDISVLLNISPDHLDRHNGMDGYIAAKKQIFARQNAADIAIVGIDDPNSRAIAEQLAADPAAPTVFQITQQAPDKGQIGVKDHQLIDWRNDTPEIILDLAPCTTIPGTHNAQNAVAAYAVLAALDCRLPSLQQAFEDFPGLPHRQERVAEIDHVAYINDSKATNVDAAARALSSYQRIYWIAGGRAKDGGYQELDHYLDRVIHGYLIGDSAPDVAHYLQGHAVPHTLSGTLDHAVAAAHDAAQADAQKPDPVVLLSPACASFDQYPNFGARGDHFRNLVQTLEAATNSAHPDNVARGEST